jgi:hypothetical protein
VVTSVTPEELVSKGWVIYDLTIRRHEIQEADFDEIMAILGLECNDCGSIKQVEHFILSDSPDFSQPFLFPDYYWIGFTFKKQEAN